MQLTQPRLLLIFGLSLLFAGITACTNNGDNPDEIRRRTAQATETMRQDTKAVVDGVKDGMARDKTVNINKASHEELLSLPGITKEDADRIIAERPYDNTHDLVKRHVVSESEYARIQDHVIADR